MSWCTTADLDKFVAAAGGYLHATAVENTLLLSAVQAASATWDPRIAGRPPGTSRLPQSPVIAPGLATAPGSPTGSGPGGPGPARPGLLFGWWEPPDGSEPRGAFLHDPARPLIIAGRAPEIAAALAGTLARLQRSVSGVDGPIEAADAFAAAWSSRAGATVRLHKNTRVYRLVAEPGVGGTGVGGAGARPAPGAGGAPGEIWIPPESQGPVGRLRVATGGDHALIAEWLTAYATETGERIGSAWELAADLIGYGGALIWESPQRTSRLRDVAQHLVSSHHRDAAHRETAHPDTAPREAGHRDAAPRETAHPDVGHRDAALRDAGHRDTGHRDTAPREAAPRDTAPRDAAFRDAAHQDAVPRDAFAPDAVTRDGGPREAVSPSGYQPAAMATLTRPIAGTVRIDIVYTPPDRRRNGFAAAVTLAASHAVLAGIAPRALPGAPSAGAQVVMITDRNRPDRRVARLGYQLVGERAVLRFGPPTGPLPSARATGPMPRLPTGPLPRFRR
jgi:hypothetical protein